MTTNAPLVSAPYYSAEQLPVEGRSRIFVRLSQNATDTNPELVKYPTVGEEPDEEGQFSYYQLAGEEALKLWKRKLGEFAADCVVRPVVLERRERWTGQIKMSRLLSFPEGYELFVQLKGPTKPRRDYYLYGSQHVRRFRSPAEFMLHLRWLMTGKPMRSDGKRCCECKGCNPRAKQKDINKIIASLRGPTTSTTRSYPGSPFITMRQRHRMLRFRENPIRVMKLKKSLG